NDLNQARSRETARLPDLTVMVPETQKAALLRRLGVYRLRGLDLNQRPSGYEPDELPGCSTPRQYVWRIGRQKAKTRRAVLARRVCVSDSVNGFFPYQRHRLQCLATTYSSSA